MDESLIERAVALFAEATDRNDRSKILDALDGQWCIFCARAKEPGGNCPDGTCPSHSW